MAIRTEQDIMASWKTYGKPLVTICCNAYNHELYIAKAITSFLMQETSFPFEILISDDCSTDNTVKIIKEYATTYPSVIKLNLEQENQYSKGQEPLSTLLAKATSKYIAICEGDDYWTDPAKLEKQLEIFAQDEDITICFHPAKVINLTTKETTIAGQYSKTNTMVSRKSVLVGGGMFMPTASIMIRNKNLHYLAEISNGFPVGDYFVMVYMASLGKTYYLSEVMCDHLKFSEGSWSIRLLDDSFKEQYWKSLLLAADRFYPLLKEKPDKKQYRNYWMISLTSALWSFMSLSKKYDYIMYMYQAIKNMRHPFFPLILSFYIIRGGGGILRRSVSCAFTTNR